jgi:hypothetical protein
VEEQGVAVPGGQLLQERVPVGGADQEPDDVLATVGVDADGGEGHRLRALLVRAVPAGDEPVPEPREQPHRQFVDVEPGRGRKVADQRIAYGVSRWDRPFRGGLWVV